jgi:hypothetical protein
MYYFERGSSSINTARELYSLPNDIGRYDINDMKKIISITLTSLGILGIGIILAILTYPLFKPDIKLSIDAPKISQDKAIEIGAVKSQTDSRDVMCASPDDRYEIEYQGVDDRGWIEKLLGIGYLGNGLTQIIVKDKTSNAQPFSVGPFFRDRSRIGAILFCCNVGRWPVFDNQWRYSYREASRRSHNQD